MKVNGLIEKKVQVVRNGKTFTQTVWVKPEVQSSNKELSQLEDLFKKDKLAGLQKLKELGITWAENKHPAINLMRAKEAMKKHYGVTQTKPVTNEQTKTTKSDKKNADKHADYLANLRTKGITWNESENVGINVMRAKMAEKKFNAQQSTPAQNQSSTASVTNKNLKAILDNSDSSSKNDILMHISNILAYKALRDKETDDFEKSKIESKAQMEYFKIAYKLGMDTSDLSETATLVNNYIREEVYHKGTLPDIIYTNNKRNKLYAYDSEGNLHLTDLDKPDSPFKTVISKDNIEAVLNRQEREAKLYELNNQTDPEEDEEKQREALKTKFKNNVLGFGEDLDAKSLANAIKYLNSGITFDGELFKEKDLYFFLYKQGYEFRETSSGKARWYQPRTDRFVDVTTKTAKDFSRYLYNKKNISILDSVFFGDAFDGMNNKDKFDTVMVALSSDGGRPDAEELKEYCVGAGFDDEQTQQLIGLFAVKFTSEFYKKCTQYSRFSFKSALDKGVKTFDTTRLDLAKSLVLNKDLPIYTQANLGAYGSCSLRSDIAYTLDDTPIVDYSRLRLRSAFLGKNKYGDMFNMRHCVSTAIHESVHATAHGKKTLFGGFEESIAEIIAVAVSYNLGFQEVKNISYSEAVATTYLLLKDEPDFSGCENMIDVGLKLLSVLENDGFDRTGIMKKYPKLRIHEKALTSNCGVDRKPLNTFLNRHFKFNESVPMNPPKDYYTFVGQAQDREDPVKWGSELKERLDAAWIDGASGAFDSNQIVGVSFLQYYLTKGVK